MVFKDYNQSSNIRDSYQILPCQSFWTWFTGMSLENDAIPNRNSSIYMLATSLMWVVIGIITTSVAIDLENFYARSALYIIGVIFSAAGSRYVVATIIHQGVHNTLFNSKKNNKLVCELLSTIFIVQPYDSYREFHVKEHHGADFSTLNDKDLAAIYKLGFSPGKSKSRLYINLLLVLFNPKFHIDFFIGRVSTNIRQARGVRKTCSLLWLMILISLMLFKGIEWSLLVLILPFIIVYQICSLLHLITEHVWLIRKDDQTVKQSHIENSLGRFCGETCPPSLRADYWIWWVKWIIKHLTIHLPYRMLVVQGSLTCHDWHHRNGGKKDWYNFSIYRRRDAKHAHETGNYDYTDAWGLVSALEYVFKNIESEHKEIDCSNISHRLN